MGYCSFLLKYLPGQNLFHNYRVKSLNKWMREPNHEMICPCWDELTEITVSSLFCFALFCFLIRPWLSRNFTTDDSYDNHHYRLVKRLRNKLMWNWVGREWTQLGIHLFTWLWWGWDTRNRIGKPSMNEQVSMMDTGMGASGFLRWDHL